MDNFELLFTQAIIENKRREAAGELERLEKMIANDLGLWEHEEDAMRETIDNQQYLNNSRNNDY